MRTDMIREIREFKRDKTYMKSDRILFNSKEFRK